MLQECLKRDGCIAVTMVNEVLCHFFSKQREIRGIAGKISFIPLLQIIPLVLTILRPYQIQTTTGPLKMDGDTDQTNHTKRLV